MDITKKVSHKYRKKRHAKTNNTMDATPFVEVYIKEEPPELINENVELEVNTEMEDENQDDHISADILENKLKHETGVSIENSAFTNDFCINEAKSDNIKNEVFNDDCQSKYQSLAVDINCSTAEDDQSPSQEGNEQCSIKSVKSKEDTGVANNKCEICGKRCKNIGGLKTHLISHTGIKHQCDICRKSFIWKRNLERHLMVHIRENFPCNLCHKVFKSDKWRKKHMINHHTEERSFKRPYICDDCGKICAQRGNLLSHMIVHTDIKEHVCTMCGKFFKTINHLTKHLLMHSSERKFKCDTCGKCFTQRGNLCTHLLLHTENRHMCHLCGKTFVQKGNLHTHFLRYHSDGKFYKEEKPQKRKHIRNRRKKQPQMHFLCGLFQLKKND